MTSYFLFAGEPSGDLHGSRLMQALKATGNSSHFIGIGGPLMRSEGVKGPLKMEDFQVMGFSDVIKAFPKLCKAFYCVRDFILDQKPQIVILIDYPGFNLRLAKSLRKKGYRGKIVQYICPTVWAHGKNRIHTMADTLDLLLTILPFEADYFAHTPLQVAYIGNPLVDNLKNWQCNKNWHSQIGLPSTDHLIALFPGSRQAEIKRHTPLMLHAASHFKHHHPQAHFALSYANEDMLPFMHAEAVKTSLKVGHDLFFVPAKFRYELMHDCILALAKSGTVTLELALLNKPSLVVYELSHLNYLMAKYILKLSLPHYSLANILGKKEIYPEIIGTNLNSSLIGTKLAELHKDRAKQKQMAFECLKIAAQLGDLPTHQMAARCIQELL